jgi:hypothetical protein
MFADVSLPIAARTAPDERATALGIAEVLAETPVGPPPVAGERHVYDPDGWSASSRRAC